MERLIAALGWFIEALGRYPMDDEHALGLYRDLEFRRDTAWTRSPDSDDEEALRLAS